MKVVFRMVGSDDNFPINPQQRLLIQSIHVWSQMWSSDGGD